MSAQSSTDIVSLDSPEVSDGQPSAEKASRKAGDQTLVEGYEEAFTNLGTISEEHAQRLVKMQQAVGTLLEYTVEKAEFDMKDDFLGQVVPLLRKPADELIGQDEIYLWSAYNQLSKLAYPVTVESLAMADEIERTGLDVWGTRQANERGHDVSRRISKCQKELRYTLAITFCLVVLFFFVQGYAIVVGEAVKTIQSVQTSYDTIQQRIDGILSAGTEITDQSPVVVELKRKQHAIEASTEGIKQLPLLFSYKCDTSEGFFAQIHCIDSVARFNLLVLSTHILPFVLGFLGATAALVQYTLNTLENKTFTHGWTGRVGLRLALGGLLGEISGVIFTPDLNELEALKLSLVFIAFLMGYSTDLAFALFDRAIETAKQALKPGTKVSEAPRKPEAEH